MLTQTVKSVEILSDLRSPDAANDLSCKLRVVQVHVHTFEWNSNTNNKNNTGASCDTTAETPTEGKRLESIRRTK
jgi:hypothetical protein